MKKIPLIHDCDPGHDDAIALLIALASDRIDLLGVTTVGGNSGLANTTENALKILELCRRTDIPVAAGRAQPLMRQLVDGSSVHGKSGMDGPVLPPPATKPMDMTAMEFIAETARKSADPLTLVATGPFSNIAAFLLAYPELKKKIERISVMGGGAFMGNRTALAEFNIWNDPEAAQIVLKSGIPVTVHGLDVTHKALILTEEFALFRARKDNPVAQFVADLLDFYAICYTGERKLPGCPMHDSCAIASLIDPSLFTILDAHIEIDLAGEATRGACSVDIRPRPRRTLPDNAAIALDVDRKRFLDLILWSVDTLGAAIQEGKK